MKPSELLAKAENWCKHYFYQSDDDGNTQYCISGALMKCQEFLNSQQDDALLNTIHRLFPNRSK
ncbi:MAG TPA: hypothetical protein VNZ45_18670, partial [Bacteroidia bacterium]|nr:hypothetical protein [Bacteroidia bacterium]